MNLTDRPRITICGFCVQARGLEAGDKGYVRVAEDVAIGGVCDDCKVRCAELEAWRQLDVPPAPATLPALDDPGGDFSRRMRFIPEVKIMGRRLGRHVEHDARSRNFAAPRPEKPLRSAAWTRHTDAFDQGELGGCTGYACLGVLTTNPFYDTIGDRLTRRMALTLYELATRLDRIAGHYPPDDTGSTGLAVAKAAVKLGFVTGYRHAFGLLSALHMLERGPVLAGVNWYDSFDSPIHRGGANPPELVITPDAIVRGGHEVELLALDVERRTVTGISSWGKSFGLAGYFVWSWDTFARLLSESGDVTELLR